MIRRSVNNLKLKQSEEEALYFKTEFRDPATVFNYPVLCTVCKKSITDDILRKNQLQSHPILGVVICRSCIQFYGDGNFSVDEDGSDKYCRWCGQGGMLNCCSVCTVAFCKSCLKKNLSRKYLNDIEKDDWRCLICNPEPLMHLRAICYAANEYVKGLRRKKKKRKYRQAFDELNSNNSTTISNRREIPKRSVVCNQDLADKQSTSKENIYTEKPTTLSKEICSLDNNTNKEDDLFPALGLIKNYANYSLKQKRSIRDLMMNMIKDLNKLSEMVIVKSEAFRKKYLEDESTFNENISSVVQDAQSILKDSICITQRLHETVIDNLNMWEDVKKETNVPSTTIGSKRQPVTSTTLENSNGSLNCSKFKNEDANSVRLSQINGECNEPEDPQEKYIKYLLNLNNLKRPCATDSENDEEDDYYRLLSKKVKSELLEEKSSTEVSDDEKCDDRHVESDNTENLPEKQGDSLEDDVNRYFRDILLNSESEEEAASGTSTVVELTSASELELDSENKPTNDEINDNAVEINNLNGKMQLAEAADVKDSNFENENQNKNNIQDKSDESDSLSIVSRKRNKDPLLNNKLLLSSSSDEETLIPTNNSTSVLGDSNKENNSGNDSDIASIIKPSKRAQLKYLSDSSDSDFCNSKRDSPSSSSSFSSKKSGANNTSAGGGLKRRRTRIVRISSTSDSETGNINVSQTSAGSGKSSRKNIRKLLGEDELAEETKRTAKLETERLKRIQERQKLYNESFNILPTENNVIESLVLDFDEETKETLISVNPGLIKKLKPHQAQGVKFMWDSTFESIKEINKLDSGSGCILAHCMGLGKTLQVVTLVHTILTHENTKVKTVLVVCPLSIVLNWVQEFNSWLSDVNSGDDINVYHLARKMSNSQRTYYLDTWRKNGGVCIMGYDMYRILINIGNRIKPNLKEMLHEAILDPGPDLVICDEGHMLKNEKTATTKAINKIKTNRRIVLTGTPIQNNLKEYFCMVQFVKPNLLGDKKEFNNRFVHPIVNGQFVDSTIHDVRLMKRRAHVLHKKLDGIVQRLDYNVLTPFLPPKYEYVVLIRLTKIQADLYEHYLNNYCRIMGSNSLFQNYQIFRLIWTHPYVLKLSEERKQTETAESSDEEGSLKDFVVDNDTTSVASSTSDSVKYVSDNDSIKSIPITATSNKLNIKTSSDGEINAENLSEGTENGNWWSQFVTDEQAEIIENGSKLIFLFSILEKCQMIGDKILIFSQSLLALDMIEHFLRKLDDNWILGLDYFRLDGSTSTILRTSFCDKFNDKDNYRARLFLISTRAGGLGINLTAANRVIILDASWNPSHDVQSIFRVFRFGQVKPCYIYRILAKGTMEEKIYERQVTKQSVSCRVVDEQQIDRHFNSADLNELYMFCKEPPAPTETPKLPVDRLMAELLIEHKNIVCSYHEHDSLLENITDEELTEEERKQAWEDYEMENRAMNLPVTMNTNTGIYGYGVAHVMNLPASTSNINFGSFPSIKIPDFETILQTVKSQHPNVTYPVAVKMVKTVIERIAKVCNDRNFLEHEILQKNSSLTDEAKYLETVRLNNNRNRVNSEINELRKRLIAYSSKLTSTVNV